ncbi:MAG: hypothetical protein FWD90_13990 [Defluviitaleaceae bacterium]|nr:hypothetical protein [Defluviitaleaceae bacterium]
MDKIKRNYYLVTILLPVALLLSMLNINGMYQAIGFVLVLLITALDPIWADYEKKCHLAIYYINKLAPFLIMLIYAARFINISLPEDATQGAFWGYVGYGLLCLLIIGLRFLAVKR